ncbi:MAG: hypothetical protein H6813_05435 [Phycisphaeraceae bacterium]|nr:hypothetical protein [Phycisphaeraceae bacterium]MCB9847826.1 hypothetical protein [Phycisphaeraceae bacterium]
MLRTDELAPIALGVIVILAALAPASVIFAWLLRAGRMVGGGAAAGILGGAIAGTLLGATVLHKSAPGVYETIYVGGAAETRELHEAQREADRDAAALAATGVTREAVTEYRAGANRKLASYVDAVSRAQRLRARALDSAGLLLLGAVMALGAGWAGRVRRRRLTGGAVASGFGLVAGAGIPVCCAAAWLAGLSNIEAWTLAAAVGIGSAWPTPAARSIGVAGRSPETDAASMVALCMGLAAVVMAVLSTRGPRSFAGVWSLAIVAAAVAACAWRAGSRRPRSQRRALAMCNGVVTPTLTAVCIAPIDVAAVFPARACVIASIAALLFASDGRWFGAWLGWRLVGEGSGGSDAWRRSAAMLAGNVGAVSIGAGALGRSAGLIGDPAMLAVLVGALFVETTGGLRRVFAVRLDAMANPGEGATGRDEDRGNDS